MNNFKKQKGFTLIEIVIVIGLVSVLFAISMPVINRLIDFSSSIESETNLQVMGKAIEEFYSENAWNIDENEESSIELLNKEYAKNGSNTLTNDSWKNIALTYTSSTNSLYDGYNHAFKIFVSNRQEEYYNGVLIPFHIIALVTGNGKSVDKNGASVVETTFDVDTGKVEVADGESVYIISGYDIQKDKFDKSVRKLDTVAKAYEDYYWSRYATRGNEPAINYFGKIDGNPRWDSDVTNNSTEVVALCNDNNSETLPNGRRALGHNIYDSGLVDELSFTQNTVKSEWDRDFRILNCGSTSNIQVNGESVTISTRTPKSYDVPPYTATLGFSLPNSETFTKTITSQF